MVCGVTAQKGMELKPRRVIGVRAAAVAVSALATLSVAGVLGAGVASAASAATVTGTTSMTNVPDTTSASGPACGTSANGPTWATDQFPTVTLSAVSTGADSWTVTITSDGSYVAFADPTTCAALISEGNITGSIQYTVTSPNTPAQTGLLSDYSGATEFSTLIDDFFGGSPTIGGGDVYTYSYQNGNYTQVGTAGGGLTITGDVKPVACTVTVTSPGNQTSAPNKAISGLQIAATSNYPGTLVFDTTQKDVNLPAGLSISSTGEITGTPTTTGTSKVTINAGNPNYLTPACVGTATFNWTVSTTASSSTGTVPTGGVETGGGKPAGDPFLPFGIILAALAVAAMGTAGGIALRRQHQGR
jgi:hypothetical protein